MKLKSLVIDNFLDDPEGIRKVVLNNKIFFDRVGYFTGKRTLPVDNIDYQNMIIEKLYKVLPFKIKMRGDSYCFQLCLSGDETNLHLDGSDWTGVLYLTPNASIDSGTLLFKEDVELIKRIKEGQGEYEKYGYTSAEVMSSLGNVYNRLVLFRGCDIPHRSNRSGFGDCVENGRLTQVFFFDEV